MSDMADFINDCQDVAYYPSRRPKTVTCSKCGLRRLRWKQHDTGKWWLADKEGNWHTCQQEENK
jgi:hypothetical protein